MEMVTTCSYHEFDNQMLVSYFYEEMTTLMKQLFETMRGGDFMSKKPDEAFQFLDYIAKVSKSQEDTIIKEPPRDRAMIEQKPVESILFQRAQIFKQRLPQLQEGQMIWKVREFKKCKQSMREQCVRA